MNTYHYGKPEFTDTVIYAKLQFARATVKEASHYAKAKNPATLYPDNFHGSRAYCVSKPDFLALVKAGEPETLEILCQEAKNRGFEGEVIVKQVAGGLGRKRYSETREAYLLRRPSGWPEVCRIWVE